MPELLADALHWALNQLNPNRPNADRIKALANELVRLRDMRDEELRAAWTARDEAQNTVCALLVDLADLKGRYRRLDEELEAERASRTTGGIPPACDDSWKNQAMPVIEEHEQSAPSLRGGGHV